MEKKAKPSVIRKIATSKQTGGGGFVFEDKVSAWFISHFLADLIPFTPEIGKIKQIDYQVRSDGWLLEDLLLTTQVNDDIDIKIAVSSKSNVQINTKGPNSDLLYDIWNEYLNIASNIFDSSKDYLCIVNSPLHPTVLNDLNKLIKFSKANDASTLHRRISQDDKAFSQSLKKLYKGFYCPEDIAKNKKIDESETVKILSRIIFIGFDFQNVISHDENKVIEICKNCLVEPSSSSGLKLYTNLCAFRGQLAPMSGFLDYQKLIDTLKDFYRLKGFNNHNNDWNKILGVSKSKIESIPDKIGNKINFSTLEELEEIHKLIQEHKALFILGKSGYGKSVLVKKYIKDKLNSNDKFVWIDAQSIQTKSLKNHFGIQHDLTELFSKVQQPNCYLFIDGVDRFFKESELKVIAQILSIASNPDSSWKIIFTCQTEDYEDVLERLYRININLNIIDFKLKIDVYSHISELRSHFPVLSELLKHNHLIPILNNLKYLDLLAYNLSKTSNITESDYIGESTIVDWIWKKEIDSIGTQSSRFIQDFSERQAQKLSISIPVSDFNISDLAPLDILKKSKVFVEIEDRLYLTHDLFGDWARYKLIRANKGNLKPFLLSKDLFSPLWCKAIRLYGIYLLENNNDASEWITLFKSLVISESNEKIIQDLLLESIFFSADIFSHLTALWDLFNQNGGKIFNRFLSQFLLKATLPNKNILNLAKEIGGYSVAEASTYDRTPNYLYWGDILNFIHSKKNEIIEVSRLKIAIITKMWLEHTPTNFLYRKECSEIALANAMWMFDFKLNGGFVKGNVDKKIYKAFLMGVNENSKEVIELALKLCKRIKVEKEKKSQDKIPNLDRINIPIFSQAKARNEVQWKDGPYERADDAFENICVEENALSPIIDNFPKQAKEVLLALFIEAPTDISFGYDYHSKLKINEPHGWFPPFYTRGPFLYFLNHNSKVGVEFIVSFVNFATEQWSNSYEQKKLEIPKLSFIHNDESLSFLGNESVYFWFRDSTGVPHAIVSALMALEKFLYDQIKLKNSISDYIEYIFKNGNSVAYFGILNSIGKLKPTFFLNELKPLLKVYDFYEWEKSLDYGAHHIEGHQMMGSNLLGKTTWELAKKWHEMPHRKTSIQTISLNLFLNHSELREYYNTIIDSWKEKLNKSESEGLKDVYLTNLISFYNYSNYESIEYEGGLYFQYKEPEKLTIERQDVRERLTDSNDSFIFPFKCFQELEQKKKYSLEECNELWIKIQSYSLLIDENPYSHLFGKHECVLGGCAVLIFNKNVWIAIHPDYLEWIIKYIDDVLTNYSINLSEMSHVEIGHSWSQFTAYILTDLWTSELDNTELKRLIALLLTKARNDTVKKIFSLLSKVLKWSNSNFVQMQNLLIQWSLAIYKDSRQYKNYNSISDDEDLKDKQIQFSLDKSQEKLVQDFASNKIKTTLIDWSKIRLVEPKIKRRSWNKTDDISIGNKPGIYLDILQPAFSSIPKISQLDSKEREYLLNLWKQIIEQIVFELGIIDEHSEKQDDYPSNFHLWALTRISELISEIKSTDNIRADYFWKQILQYGNLGGDWVNKFLLIYFLNNIENKEYHNNFFVEWRKMITYVDECETWNDKGEYYRRNEILKSLMGVKSQMIDLWKNDDYLDFFREVLSENIKIINKKILDQEILYILLIILRTKPGSNVLKEGIEIINKYLNFRKIIDNNEAPEGFVKRDFEHEDSLAKTTSFLWDNYREKIVDNELILNGFKNIVLFLVSKQNLLGIELQGRIIVN